MSRPSWLQKIYWSRFAKPIEERALFAHLVKTPVASILEVGLGSGARMRRIAKLVQPSTDDAPIRYVGTDEFESAQDGKRHLTLKQAHQIAGQLRFKATLMPGNAAAALPRVAHKVGMSDLIVIDGGLDPKNPTEGVIATWLDRVAHERSAIFACSDVGGVLELVDHRRFDADYRRAA